MSYHVITFQPNGEITLEIQPKVPPIEQCQKIVGGWVETVPYFKTLRYKDRIYTRGTCYANEEGLMKRLPLNHNATDAWRKALVHATQLVGPVVFYAKVKDDN